MALIHCVIGLCVCYIIPEVMVKEDDYLSDLQTRIQEMTKDLPVEVLRLRRDRGNVVANLQAAAKETLDELTPFDVFAKRLEQEELDVELRLQLEKRYRSIVDSLQEGMA